MQIFIARAYILLNFDTFFPISVAISPLSFSKLLRYHFDTTQLPSNTFPIPTTLYTRKIAPKCDFSCISANFIVPLQSKC